MPTFSLGEQRGALDKVRQDPQPCDASALESSLGLWLIPGRLCAREGETRIAGRPSGSAGMHAKHRNAVPKQCRLAARGSYPQLVGHGVHDLRFSLEVELQPYLHRIDHIDTILAAALLGRACQCWTSGTASFC